jgi:cell division cycle protein 20 (cofactor of APC complex)
VCTGAGDENLKFWRIWEVGSQGTKKKVLGVGDELGGGRSNPTKEGILSLR